MPPLIHVLLDAFLYTNMTTTSLEEMYDEKFYAEKLEVSILSAKVILSLMFQIYTPNSVIDVGCGIGAWLAVFKEFMPNASILGLDGEYNKKRLLIAQDEFIGCNLEDSLPSFPTKFDLAISLEVAEHLSPMRAQSFVKELGMLSDVILFSACYPRVIGPNPKHQNEQWHDYWVKFFINEEFYPLDWIRPQILDRSDLKHDYISNTLLFVRKEFFLRTYCEKCENFNWGNVQRQYRDYFFRMDFPRGYIPRFFERLGSKLDDSAFICALKKCCKKFFHK